MAILIGNWKMYKTARQAGQFIESLAATFTPSQVRLFLAAPFTTIAHLKQKSKESALPITVGAQNMHDALEGAFTGEISAPMLHEVGAEFVLLGHSERRHIFKEEDDFINRKLMRALSEGITPILCVGETLEERKANNAFAVVERQLERGLKGVSAEEAQRCMVAYEPVWAIGTGQVATPDDAQEMHSKIRKKVEHLAKEIKILYGGSVKPENAGALMAEEDIDGLLVGGASLDADSFYKIIQQCENLY